MSSHHQSRARRQVQCPAPFPHRAAGSGRPCTAAEPPEAPAAAPNGGDAGQFPECGAACGHARRKARYGHRDWLVYPAVGGQWCAERVSRAAVKRALLAAGTRGKWFMFAASSAFASNMSWRQGIVQLRNLQD